MNATFISPVFTRVAPRFFFTIVLGLLATSMVQAQYWNLTGNTGTDPAINFIGTKSGDNKPLNFKVNGLPAGQLDHLLFNSFFGVSAGRATTGSFNTAIGADALYSNISGSSNAAFGYQALYSNTGGYNTGLGCKALRSNLSGSLNVGLGYGAMQSNTIGGSNVAIGAYALYWNKEKSNLVAIGSAALKYNSSGTANVAIGSNALTSNTSGSENTAIGTDALRTNYNGIRNTAQGAFSLNMNYSGQDNTAVGHSSLRNNTGGKYNTASGFEALFSNTTGEQNTATGYQALRFSTGNLNTANGYAALLYNNTGAGNTAMGHKAMFDNTSGWGNTAVGERALDDNRTGYQNTALGKDAGPFSGYTDLYNTTALGYGAFTTMSNQITLGNYTVSTVGSTVVWSTLSDGRFKREVQENVPGLDFIQRLRPVTYHLDVHKLKEFSSDTQEESNSPKSTEEVALENKSITEREAIVSTGFIAQEVEAAAQSLGYQFDGVVAPANDKTPYSLRYALFVPPLVKAVQEQQQQIAEQCALLAEKDVKIENLETRLARLEALILGQGSLPTKQAEGVSERTAQSPNKILACFPNPAANRLTVTFESVASDAKAWVSLLDVSGKEMKKAAVLSGVASCDLFVGDLPVGTYFLKFFAYGVSGESLPVVIAR